MRLNVKQALIGAALLAGIGMGLSDAHAKPFDSKSVASDAKWVLHVDIDAMSKTQAWKLVEAKLKNDPKYVQGKAVVERIGKIRLPDDLHDVTLFGPSFGEKEAVVVIRHNANIERLKTLVSFNETYRSQNVGGQEVHVWDDKGKTMHAGFSKDGRLVIGQDQDAVIDALNTIDGKSAPLKSEVMIPKPNEAGLLIYLAGDQVAEIAKGQARSPLVQKLKSMWLKVSSDATGLKMTSQVQTDDAAAADDVKQAIDGIKVGVSFAAQDDPDAMLLSDAITDLTASTNDKSVDLKMSLTDEMLTQLLERVTGEISRKTD